MFYKLRCTTTTEGTAKKHKPKIDLETNKVSQPTAFDILALFVKINLEEIQPNVVTLIEHEWIRYKNNGFDYTEWQTMLVVNKMLLV